MLQTFAAFDEDGGAPSDSPGGGTLFYFEVDDLAGMEAALGDAEILIPRRRMFYGAHELVVEPGGHIITFEEFEAQ